MVTNKKYSFRTEAIAGVTTFFTMAYIIVLNPQILSSPGTGLQFNAVLSATVVLCFLMTLFMGVYAKLPYAVAPGMGINAFFTFSLILGKQIPWPTALGMVFWSGVIFVLISVTPIRESIGKAIPQNLRVATAAGIGIFLAFIGLKNAGLIEADPATFVRFKKIDSNSLLSIAGFVLMVWLWQKKSSIAFLAGILFVTAAAWATGKITLPEHIFSQPDFHSHWFQMDLWGSLQWSLAPAIVSLMFTDLFDSISTFIGVSEATGMKDAQGQPKRLKQGLIVDAFATLTAGLFGSSSGTAYIESSAGIEAGGRTGITSVVTAFCFLPFLFVAPLASMVPTYATAPVLILVGSMMFRTIQGLDFKRMENAIPAYLTIILIPLTFSITQGILWGFLSHVGLQIMAGKGRSVKPMLYLLALVSALLLWIEGI